MMQKSKKIWAILLSAAIIVTQLPAAAMAEDSAPEDKVNFAEEEREDSLGLGSTAHFELPGRGGISTATPSDAKGGAVVYTINDRFTVDGLTFKELGPDTVQLMGYVGDKPEGTLIIPDTVIKPENGREYRVIRIGENAFDSCTGLTGDLIIPDTVIEIGDMAFSECNFTGELMLSDSLIKIGSTAFYNSGFTGELNLPEKLTRIEAGAFSKTGFTGRLILPEELTYIGTGAFSDCKFTGDLLIPDSVTYIGGSAFYDSGFTGKLTLPKGLTEIEREMFTNCGFTGELTIPDTVTRIGQNAFQNCNFTGQLVLPDGITSIGTWGFYGCSGLTGRLRVPDGLTKIETWAFKGTNIDAFDTTKQEVADLIRRSGVPGDKIMVGNQPYQPSAGKTFQYKDMEYEILEGDSVKLISYSGNPDKDLIIPDMVSDSSGKSYFVTHIGEYALFNEGITGSLRLPDTLVCIEQGAFIFNEFSGRLDLPDTLIYIGDMAFYYSGFTGDLSIPENVSYIGGGAFANTGFTGDLTIEGKLTEIGDSAFYMCGFTGALSLPDALTSIGEAAFYGCGFTGSLSLPAELEIIRNSAFYDCSGFSGALNLPEPVTEIGSFAFYGCTGFASAHLGSNLQKLGQQAFPESLPISTDSPRVQLLLNTYLNQETIANTAWDGKEDVPDGAIASVKQDTVVTGDKRIGKESVITVQDGIMLTVDGSLKIDGTIFVNGTLVINGSVSGSGTLIIGRKGRVEGSLSGFPVEYPEDIEDAKNMIEGRAYTVEQGTANDEAAIKAWLKKTMEEDPGFRESGVLVKDVILNSLTPAAEGTFAIPGGADGSFTFTMSLSKGHSGDTAAGSGIITARRYVSDHQSEEEENPDILYGTWIQTDNGIWMFRQTNGAYARNRWGIVDGLWYYFNGEGQMLTGWQFINSRWYYLYTKEDGAVKNALKEGAMASGWYFDPAYQQWFYLEASGNMVTGWHEIDGKWYCFNPVSDGQRGMMYADAWIDGWYVDKKGVWNGDAK